MVLTTQLHIGNLIPRCIFYFADVNQNSPINHTERQIADDSTMSFMESSKVNILKKNKKKTPSSTNLTMQCILPWQPFVLLLLRVRVFSEFAWTNW